MEAIKAGGIMPTVLNAANEMAVEAFLNEQNIK
jgi:1-deoxy-D-xylulose-5-phosphate reductoisomerase